MKREPLSLLTKMSYFWSVKKAVAVFLLFQILSNNSFAEELIKLPGLFTHFYHHTNEHKDTKDFVDFLHKHYSDHHKKDKHAKNHSDEDNDCNLPFKHCGDCCLNVHATVASFLPSALNTEFIPSQIQDNFFYTPNDRIESLELCSIWQPPKLA